MYSRSFDTLEDVIREAREELSTYRDILEISERIKKWNLKRNFLNPEKIFRQRFQILKGGENTFSAGASPGSLKKSGSLSSRVDDLKDVEYFKCHKKGHYANKCPESKVKDGKAPMKVRKWKILNLKLIQKLSRFARFEFDIRTLKNEILTHL